MLSTLRKFKLSFPFLFGLISSTICCMQAKSQEVPAVYSNMGKDENGFFIEINNNKVYEVTNKGTYQLTKVKGNPKGTANGIDFDFGNKAFAGKLFYGFIPYGDSNHPQPVFFKTAAKIIKGKAAIDIGALAGKYDMIGWQKTSKGTIGYRVVAENGDIIYDGKVAFTGKGPFQVSSTIIEGPFVNLLAPTKATISFESNRRIKATIKIDGKVFTSSSSQLKHEIEVNGLKPNTKYDYTLDYGNQSQTYSLKTAPLPGTRTSFSFAYASDSRNGNGGGERNVYGANFYIMKKIMALSTQQNVAFMQFSGDLINGYLTDQDEMNLQYANWKRAVEPFWHHLPIYVGMGNHEALLRRFKNTQTGIDVSVDRFPFQTSSAEVAFANQFVNPTNGPESEDGASYDPNLNQIDFPPYKETVFFYTYDNIGVVVLNSNYFYAPSQKFHNLSSGGLHAYIMDQQLKWFEATLDSLEKDPAIDHIFVTQHTPFFPNGGHVKDDMWYDGNNDFRPVVNGKPVDKGIIERRDDLLTLAVNKNSKVVAILTGDEHNYARTEIGPETNIYPENYPKNKIKLHRTIYQINNGAAGAPYYAQENTPWTPFVKGFTTQNALVIFSIQGKHVEMEVINPDTLESFDTLKLR